MPRVIRAPDGDPPEAQGSRPSEEEPDHNQKRQGGRACPLRHLNRAHAASKPRRKDEAACTVTASLKAKAAASPAPVRTPSTKGPKSAPILATAFTCVR